MKPNQYCNLIVVQDQAVRENHLYIDSDTSTLIRTVEDQFRSLCQTYAPGTTPERRESALEDGVLSFPGGSICITWPSPVNPPPKKPLSRAQKKLYEDLRTETESFPGESPWVEIHPSELRTARALEQRGLIEIHEDHDVRLLTPTPEISHLRYLRPK